MSESWREAVARGEKIDPVKHGIGCTNQDETPNARINGKTMYRRIFIRLRTPYETLTCRPIKDGEDFARRCSIIENWYKGVTREGNIVLEFTAYQVSDEEADEMEKEGI